MQARRAGLGKRPREDAALGACAAEPTPCASSAKLARLSNTGAAPAVGSAASPQQWYCWTDNVWHNWHA